MSRASHVALGRLMSAAAGAADGGSRRYGGEFDFRAGVPVNKLPSAELRAAFFDRARPGFADRCKAWPTLQARD